MLFTLEVGVDQVEKVEHLAREYIPVWALLCLTPQSVHLIGGF